MEEVANPILQKAYATADGPEGGSDADPGDGFDEDEDEIPDM